MHLTCSCTLSRVQFLLSQAESFVKVTCNGCPRYSNLNRVAASHKHYIDDCVRALNLKRHASKLKESTLTQFNSCIGVCVQS